MKRTSWSAGLSVTADGVGVIAHAGAIVPRLLADQVGLAAELSGAMARRQFIPIHDRGRVLIDTAVMLADGGESISDIGVLRHQSEALGPVASAPTVWRTLDEITAGKRKKIQVARARTRRHVWSVIPGGVPASACAGRDLGATIVLDVDATIVVTHSEKENATPTYKRTFGYHPIGVWCDNTEEFLAASLRPGNAGSNTAADHIDVLGQAIAQIPAARRRDLLIRSDGAGASHDLLDWITEQNRVRGRQVEYSVGFSITAPMRRAIATCPEAAWGPALNPNGDIRDGAEVAELTGFLSPRMLAKWPDGMRVIVRRERPPPRRPVVDVRGDRRVALPGICHQHRHRSTALPRSQAPGSRPSRRPNPPRQRHRARPTTLPRVRPQPGLAGGGDDRRRSGGMDTDARLHRRRRRPGVV